MHTKDPYVCMVGATYNQGFTLKDSQSMNNHKALPVSFTDCVHCLPEIFFKLPHQQALYKPLPSSVRGEYYEYSRYLCGAGRDRMPPQFKNFDL